MTPQRVNVVAWDDGEVTLQLDKATCRVFSASTKQFKIAAAEFRALIDTGELKGYEVAGDRAVTFTFHRSGQWDAIKSELLRSFILGTGDTAGEVAFYEIGADQPFERGKIVMNDESALRRYELIQPVAA